jgi:hypothetical protein
MRSIGSVILCVVVLVGGCSSSAPDASNDADTIIVSGLWPMKKGSLVYDSNQLVFWLADANLAYTVNHPSPDPQLSLAGVADSGAMTFNDALAFVNALNSYDNGAGAKPGWLGHQDWQLPTAAADGTGCKSMGPQNNAFGYGCNDSGMGDLYLTGLGKKDPNTIYRVSDDQQTTKNPPFTNLQPSLYWSSGPSKSGNPGGHQSFSFATGDTSSNVDGNNFYVLPRRATTLSQSQLSPLCPKTNSLVMYQSSFVLQCSTGFIWLADANFAKSQTFKNLGATVQIARDGAMPFVSANGDSTTSPPTLGFIQVMNGGGGVTPPFPGITDWQLPATNGELGALDTDLGYMMGQSVDTTTEQSGPFVDIQPFLYWSCKRDPDSMGGSSQSPCLCNTTTCPDAAHHAGTNPRSGELQDFSFNWGDGFTDTTDDSKLLYLMVYYPQKITPPSMKCTTPITCCAQAGGYWDGQYCE